MWGAATKEVFWAEGRAGAKAYRRKMALCLGGSDSHFGWKGVFRDQQRGGGKSLKSDSKSSSQGGLRKMFNFLISQQRPVGEIFPSLNRWG